MPDRNSPHDPAPRAPSPEDETTGLPGLRNWRSVYWVVFGCFLLWVFLLALLARTFA